MAARKSQVSVKARMHQLESAVASAEHVSSHPELLRHRQKVGSTSSSVRDEESEDETFQFRELVKALTLDGAVGGKDGSELDALRETFKILDCDEDGFITLSDLRESMNSFESDEEDNEEEGTRLGDEDLIEMIAAADERGDGKITFESFVKMIEPRDAKGSRDKRKKRAGKAKEGKGS